MTPPAPVSFGTALRYWLKLGFISFGGPAGQIALMHEELVVRKRWISERRFLHALNFCMLLPGPEAQQLATYLGWLMHRTRGGLVAGVFFVLPSFFVLTALSWVYMAWGQVPVVAGVFHGLKPAVTALVVQAGWRIGSRTLRNRWLWGIALAAWAALALLQLPFPLIIGGAALAGVAGQRLAPQAFTRSSLHAEADAPNTDALIGDDTPTPPHARFAWPRFVRTALVGLGLWGGGMGLLLAGLGARAVLTQMAWFFTKAALLTFGGAYAVLPYVFQGAVEQQHWLSGAQMMDGLALGETTPGPLIMVVAFVGFVGGWTQGVSAAAPWLGGVTAAALVCFFTFLPSILFVLLGAPFIESTRDQPRLAAPLAAITAAVVGVIANLALTFAWQVFRPAGAIDGPAVLIGALALLALLRWRLGVIPVLLASGAAGALLALA